MLVGNNERVQIDREAGMLGITLAQNREGFGVEILRLDSAGACAAAGLYVGQATGASSALVCYVCLFLFVSVFMCVNLVAQP